MTKISIQPKQLRDGTLPYPYHIDQDGYVGRQDYWQGNPYLLIGFAKKPVAGECELEFKDFWMDPQKAVGMYPVFSTAQDSWYTQTQPIEAVTVR